VEAASVEAAQPVEAPPPVPSDPEPERNDELSREEFLRIADEFGEAIAVRTVRENGNYLSALKAAFAASKAEAERLRASAPQPVTQQTHGTPVPHKAAPAKKSLFNTGK
jgi:hypothetical protein